VSVYQPIFSTIGIKRLLVFALSFIFMLPESEINDLITELERANKLISEQESRIEFLTDSGEDVGEFSMNLSKAKEKRDKLQRALEKQINIVTESQKSTTGRKSA